eukprot:c15365_g1_i2.p1 GENE.c15365_g1_i2~~c15365_g1_i2.p1  ORF type:complete len:125 (-),score=17.98 c15365_g1_i2:169-543(-)
MFNALTLVSISSLITLRQPRPRLAISPTIPTPHQSLAKSYRPKRPRLTNSTAHRQTLQSPCTPSQLGVAMTVTTSPTLSGVVCTTTCTALLIYWSGEVVLPNWIFTVMSQFVAQVNAKHFPQRW